MNTAVAIQDNAPSIIADMAKRYGMDKRAFEATVKATCMPANVTVSNEQFVAFLLVAKEYNLNPITKEIFAFPSRGGIMPIVGVDGWCNIINSNSQLDGIEFADIMTDGKLSAITCRIFRKDRAKPIECTEYMDECRIESKEPWKKWPARMLRHKALIQCARYAFSLSGIVDQDEAERMEMVDVTPQDKNAHFMRDVRDAIQDEINAPRKELAAEAAKQVAAGVILKKTPFKTKTARDEYVGKVKAACELAKSPEEIASVLASYDMVDLMAESENEHDRFAYKDVMNHYRLYRNRLLIATRETAEPEDNTFDHEEAEVPAYLRKEMEAEAERKAAASF